MLASAAELRVCAVLQRRAWELWALRGYFSPGFNGCLAQKAFAVSGNQLFLRVARRKYRYLFVKFKGNNTFTKGGIIRSLKVCTLILLSTFLSIWVSSMGYSFLAVCSGLPGGGFYVLYFHPGIVLAEDDLNLGGLGCLLGFQRSCRFFFFSDAKPSLGNFLILTLIGKMFWCPSQ